MIVKHVLHGRRGNVIAIEPTADLAAAVKLLGERRIAAVVILGADDRIVGILSERDIVRTLAEHGPTALHQPVGQVMTRDVQTCSETDTIESLMGRMTAGKFRHIPVVEQGKLVCWRIITCQATWKPRSRPSSPTTTTVATTRASTI